MLCSSLPLDVWSEILSYVEYDTIVRTFDRLRHASLLPLSNRLDVFWSVVSRARDRALQRHFPLRTRRLSLRAWGRQVGEGEEEGGVYSSPSSPSSPSKSFFFSLL